MSTSTRAPEMASPLTSAPPPSLADQLEETRRRCTTALGADELAPVGEALGRLGVGEAEQLALVRASVDTLESRQPVAALAERVTALGVATADAAVERWLLLLSALRHLDAMAKLPVSESVKREFCREFDYFAAPPAKVRPEFGALRPDFPGMSRLASLRRFPAGQAHFVTSGLPRSWLLKPKGLDKLKLAAFTLARLRGVAPMFFLHMSWKKKLVLSEKEQYRSYYRIAETMKLQPEIRGIAGASWFHSPDTFRVTPHLEWVNRVFLENGGFVTIIGPAHPTGGVFQNDVHRRRLWEAGQFQPTTGLALWPRRAVLAWAAAHPEWAA